MHPKIPLWTSSDVCTGEFYVKHAKKLIVVFFDFSKFFVSLNFVFLGVAQVCRGSRKVREVRRIHFLLSWYLSEAVVPSYVHLGEQVNDKKGNDY